MTNDDLKRFYPQGGDKTKNDNFVRYDANGHLPVPTPTSDTDAVTKKYVDDGFVAKQTSSSTYPKSYVKSASGTATELVDVTSEKEPSSIVQRDTDSQIAVPDVPTDDSHATSKKYVDTKTPDAPSEVGTYILKAVVTEESTTYSWIAETQNQNAEE